MQIKVVQQKRSPGNNHTNNLRSPGNSCLSFFVFSVFSSVQDASLLALSYSL